MELCIREALVTVLVVKGGCPCLGRGEGESVTTCLGGVEGGFPCHGGGEGGTLCLGRGEGGIPCLGGVWVELIILEGMRVQLGCLSNPQEKRKPQEFFYYLLKIETPGQP